jgi:hypothetical protein
MKKSEAINKLEKKFGLDCEGQPDAESMIDFLQELGMLPPLYEWEEKSDKAFYCPSDGSIIENPIIGRAEFVWEPE